MAEAKTGLRKQGITPGDDVLPRYLQGSMYTTRVLRHKASSGGAKKLGSSKRVALKSSVATDRKGYTVGGWSASIASQV
jgi:hypothetical protein